MANPNRFQKKYSFYRQRTIDVLVEETNSVEDLKSRAKTYMSVRRPFDVGGISATALITESGEAILTESGEEILTES